MSHLTELSQAVLSLSHSIDRLGELVHPLGFSSPQHDSWYELLKHKVVGQLSKRPYLVVAVMGGTNTGKSVVFNHLAGEHASASDHRAAGTKHPVCLIPPDAVDHAFAGQTRIGTDVSFDEETPEELLARHFDSFRIRPWTRPEDPLEESPEHRLFWRVGGNVPARLLLLDTPDIDSDAEVNWERAGTVRQTADLLIAVLTEQKYADAAVKRFFREAHDASKPIILLFNMIDPKCDIPEIAVWTRQFEHETGAKPSQVLFSPRDKAAAESLGLTFHVPAETPPDHANDRDRNTVNEIKVAHESEREPEIDGVAKESDNRVSGHPVDLSRLLSELHFETIKTRTLFGALRLICEERTGIRGYLGKLREEASVWSEARKTLQNDEGVRMPWPEIPVSLLSEEVRIWWDRKRPGWSGKVHGFYRMIGAKLSWAFRTFRRRITQEPPLDPEECFLKEETRTITKIVEGTIARLERLARTPNPVLRGVLEKRLSGENRKIVLDKAKSSHRSPDSSDSRLSFEEGFRNRLHETLDLWTAEHPGKFRAARMFDTFCSIARPASTAAFVILGYLYVGARFQGTFPVVASVLFVTGAGESLVGALGEGIKRVFAMMFHVVPKRYAEERARRFCDWFRHEIQDSLFERLEQGETIVDSPQFHETETVVAEVVRLYDLVTNEQKHPDAAQAATPH